MDKGGSCAWASETSQNIVLSHPSISTPVILVTGSQAQIPWEKALGASWFLACKQCSRVKPSYKFHFEGLSNFSPLLVEELVSIRDVNPRI
jgi:hypothetical protein